MNHGLNLSFGNLNHKSYPVVAQILNLPIHFCNSTKYCGGKIISWLPVVTDDTFHQGYIANHRWEVWHTAILYILESLKEPSEIGDWFPCTNDINRHLFSSIHIASLDYKKQITAVLNWGVHGNAACLGCELETQQFASSIQSGLPHIVQFYKRLYNDTQNLTQTEYDAKERVEEIGLAFRNYQYKVVFHKWDILQQQISLMVHNTQIYSRLFYMLYIP
ncbi:hypothetical protein C8Q75DRAFT_732760 [Abortiporus biennis]|nr:hypothetical protein C8Q75DRAFT_732760 [Abortiporus biennis]